MFLNLDYWLLHKINQVWTAPWADMFFPAITDLNKLLLFQLIAYPLIAFAFWFHYKKKSLVLFLGLALAIGASDLLGGQVVKKHFNRKRPFNNPEISVTQRSTAGAYSFYSNHSSNMFTFAVYTAQFIPGSAFVVYPIATAVAYSRVYNGVHYPSDILAGGLMGSLLGYIFSKLFSKLAGVSFKKRKKT